MADQQQVDEIEKKLQAAIEMIERQLAATQANLAARKEARRDLFAGMALMGLASRLQPLQVESKEHRQRVINLSVELADGTIAKLDETKDP